MPVGIKLPGEPAGIEDQVVTLRRHTVEFNLCAAVNPGNACDFGIDVAGPGALAQQFPHQVGGQVVAVGHVFWIEMVDEVLVTNAPSLECNTVLTGPVKKLLDVFVRQICQLLQMRNQARPTAFAHPYDRDAGVVYVVQFMLRVRVKTGHGSGRQGPCGSPADHCDLL